VQGSVDSVAPLITVNEQSNHQTQTALFTVLLHLLHPEDHITRIYYRIKHTPLYLEPCLHCFYYFNRSVSWLRTQVRRRSEEKCWKPGLMWVIIMIII